MLEQRAADALALMPGADHQLAQLLAVAEPHVAGERDQLAGRLGDRVAAVRLRGEELDERALAEPVRAHVGVGQVALVGGDDAGAAGGVVHRVLGEREGRLEVGGRPLAKLEIGAQAQDETSEPDSRGGGST